VIEVEHHDEGRHESRDDGGEDDLGATRRARGSDDESRARKMLASIP